MITAIGLDKKSLLFALVQISGHNPHRPDLSTCIRREAAFSLDLTDGESLHSSCDSQVAIYQRHLMSACYAGKYQTTDGSDPSIEYSPVRLTGEPFISPHLPSPAFILQEMTRARQVHTHAYKKYTLRMPGLQRVWMKRYWEIIIYRIQLPSSSPIAGGDPHPPDGAGWYRSHRRASLQTHC